MTPTEQRGSAEPDARISVGEVPLTLGEGGTNGAGMVPVTKIQRTIEVLRVLKRHQFFQFIKEVGQAERTPVAGGGTELRFPPEAPVRARRMLEDLGPTFIKVGQLLGTRPDLIPKPFVNEFKNLYDKTPPTPFAEVREVVEGELGKNLEEVFATFDREPVASASIGQVHFATLRSGERVAVKVQHPGIEGRIALDFEILAPIVGFIEKVFAGSRIWQPEAHLQELRVMLAKELDYTYEARNSQRVFDNFRGVAGVKIPRVHWEFTGRRVLTLEYIDGLKMEDIEAGNAPGLDGRSVAQIITTAMGKQIFEDRIFHADPSPGNILILDSHTVAFLDFGAVGFVTRRRSERILGLLVGFWRDDIDMVAENLIGLCNKTGPFDPSAFKKDLEHIMEYTEQERASPGDRRLLELIIDLAEQHHMLLPPDFMLITRSLFQFEGMCRALDPDYELIKVLGPTIQKILFARYVSPERQKDALIDIGIATAELVKHAPGRINSLLRKLEHDEFTLKMDVRGIEQYQVDQRRNVQRLSMSILAAVSILGAAIIMAFGRTEDLLRFAFVALFVILGWTFIMMWTRPPGH